MLYPHDSYSLYGFSSEPMSLADWEVLERVMILQGVKDMFMTAAIFASAWYGTRKSAGLLLLAASACAGIDRYVVGKEAGTNHSNHRGYGGLIDVLEAVMMGLFG